MSVTSAASVHSPVRERAVLACVSACTVLVVVVLVAGALVVAGTSRAERRARRYDRQR